MSQQYHTGGVVRPEGAPYTIGELASETRVPREKYLMMAAFMRERLTEDPGAEVKIDIRANDYAASGRTVHAEWTK